MVRCKRYIEYFSVQENDQENYKNNEEDDEENDDDDEEEDTGEEEEDNDEEEENSDNDEEENFVVYENSKGTLAKKSHNKPITGYNYDNYSEYKFSDTTYCLNPNGNKDIPPPLHNNYIFPPRRKNNTNKIKHASKPWLLQHECDVNRKILEYESADIFPDFYPTNSYTNRAKNTKL